MDNYQSFALKNVVFNCIDENKISANVNIENDYLVIIQNENYHILNYDLIIVGDNIEKVEYFTNKWIDSSKYTSKWEEVGKKIIPVLFTEKTIKIRITFSGGLVDPVELSLKYVEADKEKWDLKRKEEVLASYANNINLCSNAGTTFFETLYFKKCSELCVRTVIEWYVIAEKREDIYERGSRRTVTSSVVYLLGKDAITNERCYSNSPSISKDQTYHELWLVGGTMTDNSNKISFKSIGYVIRQYDAFNKLLIEIASANIKNKK